VKFPAEIAPLHPVAADPHRVAQHIAPSLRSVAGVRQGTARDACGAVGAKRVARPASPIIPNGYRRPRAPSRRDPLADAGAPPKLRAVPYRASATERWIGVAWRSAT
jgi:hypothetical protein